MHLNPLFGVSALPQPLAILADGVTLIIIAEGLPVVLEWWQWLPG